MMVQMHARRVNDTDAQTVEIMIHRENEIMYVNAALRVLVFTVLSRLTSTDKTFGRTASGSLRREFPICALHYLENAKNYVLQ